MLVSSEAIFPVSIFKNNCFFNVLIRIVVGSVVDFSLEDRAKSSLIELGESNWWHIIEIDLFDSTILWLLPDVGLYINGSFDKS